MAGRDAGAAFRSYELKGAAFSAEGLDLHVFASADGAHALTRDETGASLPAGGAWTYLRTRRVCSGVGTREVLRAVSEHGYFVLEGKCHL